MIELNNGMSYSILQKLKLIIIKRKKAKLWVNILLITTKIYFRSPKSFRYKGFPKKYTFDH